MSAGGYAATYYPWLVVNDPVSGSPYEKDPRYVARKAEEYLVSTGLADTSYWGP